MARYPFPSLVAQGRVREARVRFAEVPQIAAAFSSPTSTLDEQLVHFPGGIEIDEGYRVTGINGEADFRIYDLAFPHTMGIRPYSYGLQACNDTAAIAVAAMLDSAVTCMGSSKSSGKLARPRPTVG
jgi:hypothetical protein